MAGPAPSEDYHVTVQIAPDLAPLVADVLSDQSSLEKGRCDSTLLDRLGDRLFRLAFPTPAAVADLAIRLAGAVRGRATLRLFLYMPEAEAALLPWEYLRLSDGAVAACLKEGLTLPDEDRFLALHPSVSLVRQSGDLAAADDLARIGRLRVLIAWAEPVSWMPIAGIAAEAASVARILNELPRSHVEVETVAHATPGSLRERVLAFRPHVLHYAGHGAVPPAVENPGDGVSGPSLVLEASPPGQGQHAYLSAADLRSLCADAGVQVAILNSCWGAKATPQFVGLAQSLTASVGPGKPVPVAVAHQKPVRQSAAPAFAWALYKKLVFGSPLEDGVRAFRRECVEDGFAGVGSPDWGTPVVFLSVLHAHLFRYERVDLYPLDFGELIREHVPIVGREFVRDELARFQAERQSGVFLLTAPPGIGKTALLAQLCEDDPAAVHFFYRAAGGMTDPDEWVNSTYEGLLGRYGICEENPTSDRTEMRRRLTQWLLPKVSERCAQSGRRELILMDALDESGVTVLDHKNALEVLPETLPDHVYLLITSRPGPLADQCAARFRSTLAEMPLDPSSARNLEDAAEFCARELRGRLTEVNETILRRLGAILAQRAEGNFLVLKLFLQRDALRGGPTAADVEREATDLTGDVQNEYEVFFARARRGLENEPEKMDRLDDVLGAFVTAKGPVTSDQVCAAFGVTPGYWDWARWRVRQFLSAGLMRRRDHGAEAYRIYHETFRAFLRERLMVRLSEFHSRWAAHAENWRELEGYEQAYALRHLVSHLIASARREKR